MHAESRQTKEVQEMRRGRECCCPTKNKCPYWSSCFPLLPFHILSFAPLHPPSHSHVSSFTLFHLLSSLVSLLLPSSVLFSQLHTQLCQCTFCVSLMVFICLFFFFHSLSVVSPSPLFKALKHLSLACSLFSINWLIHLALVLL